jgi:uncharacterized protein (DUF2141 family)
MVGKSARTTAGKREYQREAESLIAVSRHPSHSLSAGRLLRIVWALLGLLFLTCADIGSPPGGEEDITGPRLIGSEPKNESVGVPPGRKIVLYFSEPITRPRSGRVIFVSPRPSAEPGIDWKKDRIEIELPDSFAVGQTYVITAGAAISDWRGNTLDSAAIIAFSTGQFIDTGSISGQVTRVGQPSPGAYVGLYALDSLTASVAYDSTYPDYLATTSRSGEFEFRYIPPGPYRLIAFMDKNSDERPNPLREQFAVPDRPIVVGGPLSLQNLDLRITTMDTTTPEILSATMNPDGLIRVRLSLPVDARRLEDAPDRTMLIPSDTTGDTILARGIQEAAQGMSSNLTIDFGIVPAGIYSVHVIVDEDGREVIYEPLEIKSVSDDTPPQITSFEPGEQPQFADQIDMQMVFSEPLDTTEVTDQTFLLLRPDSSIVSLERQWRDPFRLHLIPEQLRPGQTYELAVTEFDLVDRAGNPVGDSLRQYKVATLDEDSLGSISGEIVISIPEPTQSPVVLRFRNVERNQTFAHTLAKLVFRARVPAGKYLLSAFIDSNGDGELSAGSLYPMTFSETLAHYPDTVFVRARFETSGIILDVD